MTKIILILWTVSPSGDIDRLDLGGFFDLGDCKAALVSLTEPNPADGWSPEQVGRCLEVPK